LSESDSVGRASPPTAHRIKRKSFNKKSDDYPDSWHPHFWNRDPMATGVSPMTRLTNCLLFWLKLYIGAIALSMVSDKR